MPPLSWLSDGENEPRRSLPKFEISSYGCIHRVLQIQPEFLLLRAIVTRLSILKNDVDRVCEATSLAHSTNIAYSVSWTTTNTKRNLYGCHPVTTCCIVLKRLRSPATGYDLEPTFGLHYSHLVEVFWEVFELFVHLRGPLVISLQERLLHARAYLMPKQYSGLVPISQLCGVHRLHQDQDSTARCKWY